MDPLKRLHFWLHYWFPAFECCSWKSLLGTNVYFLLAFKCLSHQISECKASFSFSAQLGQMQLL